MAELGWGGVRDRVLALRHAPPTDDVFGSIAHRFELEPALTEPELQDAEGYLGVVLPSEYRGFLLEVGAGGAGPAYGVFPLRRRKANGWYWEAEVADRTDISLLPEPFAPSHVDGVEIDPQRLRAPLRYEFEYYDEFTAAHEAWERIVWHPERTAGAVCLCDQGCLQKDWLVVSGEERGTIWRDLRADGIGLTPLFDGQGNRITFGRWYMAWLDGLERRLTLAAQD